MKEIGGYIELDKYYLPMLHEGAVALNCGRNCLAYIIRARRIQRIRLPYYLCDSVRNVCKRENVEVEYYSLDKKLLPQNLTLKENEWLYLVNYYGQVSNEYIAMMKDTYGRIIVDNSQAYFQLPVKAVDTLYTCRKFFGVPDGAFLYTDARLDEELSLDESFDRMHFLLGRFERSASEFYDENVKNNKFFATEPIKKMSKLTDNLLRGIDYGQVKQKRTENFNLLYENLQHINLLKPDKIEGAFAYPLLLQNGMEIKKNLIKKKIYIPTLWPNVLSDVAEDALEYKFANDVLPVPCDQRYCCDDMKAIIKYLMEDIKYKNGAEGDSYET